MEAFGACLSTTVVILMLLLHALIADSRAKPIALSVYPSVSFAPATVRVTVRVHPDPSDRWIQVVLDSGEFYRRTDFTIEGDRLLYSWTLPSLPAGDYEARAAIGSAGNARASDRVTVVVQGS